MRYPPAPRWLALGIAAIVSSGCFRYVPVPLETLPDGQDVRLLVTRQGAFELSEVTNIDGAAPMLRGTLVGREPQTLMVRVPVAARQEGLHMVSLGQTIRVPEGEILQAERREFDPVRTGALALGAAAGAAYIILSIMDAQGAPPGEGDPGDLESRVPLPLIRVPIGF